MSPIPDYGDHITLEEFSQWVKTGYISEDDGSGSYATATEVSDLYLDLDNWRSGAVPVIVGFTHVIWFNK